MILYHGTTLSNGKLIIKEKKLRIDAPRIYNEDSFSPTTNNYVYLTNDVVIAMYYGNKHSVFAKENEFYIFKVDIPPEILQGDPDELKILDFFKTNYTVADRNNPTAVETLSLVKSARVPCNIELEKTPSSYIILPSAESNCSDDVENISNIISYREQDNEYVNKLKLQFTNNLEWIEI